MNLNSFFGVEQPTIVRGFVCGLPADATSYDAEPLQIELPSDIVMAFGQSSVEQVKGGKGIPAGLPYIVFINQYGDPVTYQALPDGIFTAYTGDAMDYLMWRPTGGRLDTWRTLLKPLRTTPFYEEPAECRKPDRDAKGNLQSVTRGYACLNAEAIPAQGPQLDSGFAAELARRFAAESVAGEPGQMSTLGVALVDGDGTTTMLSWDAANPPSFIGQGRTWICRGRKVEGADLYGFKPRWAEALRQRLRALLRDRPFQVPERAEPVEGPVTDQANPIRRVTAAAAAPTITTTR